MLYITGNTSRNGFFPPFVKFFAVLAGQVAPPLALRSSQAGFFDAFAEFSEGHGRRIFRFNFNHGVIFAEIHQPSTQKRFKVAAVITLAENQSRSYRILRGRYTMNYLKKFADFTCTIKSFRVNSFQLVKHLTK